MLILRWPHSPKLVVLEELGDDGGLEQVGVPHDEGQAVFRPAKGTKGKVRRGLW